MSENQLPFHSNGWNGYVAGPKSSSWTWTSGSLTIQANSSSDTRAGMSGR